MAKTNRNPYAISFGRIPGRYIERDYIVDEIVDTLNSDPVEEQAFKLTGIRGAGKTVTLTAIERELRDDEQWIIVGLRPDGEVTKDLISNLYSEIPFITKFIDANLNLSLLGFGVNIAKKSPTTSLDSALKQILREVKKKGARVLVTIDEIRNTPHVIEFIQEFQILIREDLPIYLVAAGLYDDIESVENTDGLTFFLRATAYDMTPLSIEIIRQDYEETLGLSASTAKELAEMTKGYAFAYQAFGKYMWDSGTGNITPLVLAQVDDVLARKVYDKLWSELSSLDKWYLSFIAEKETMSAAELLEKTKKNHSQWSVPRKKLIDKRILESPGRGLVSIKLPRFREYVQRQLED